MIKKMMSSGVSFCAIGTLLMAQNLSAAEVQLKRFRAGDVIYADDVNGNFQALAEIVKQLEKRTTDLEQRNAALEAQNRALQAEIAALKKQPVAPAPTSTPQLASQTSSTKTPKYSLRNTPQTVSGAEAQQVFGLDQHRRPLQYTANDFERKGDIVIDHATGLMWQQSGSSKQIRYQEAQQYVQQINRERFGGYRDWRLPTVPELLSLIEMKQQTNGLYINPIFDGTQRWFWSADNQSAESAWLVNFNGGNVSWYNLHDANYVRCVRSGQ